MFKKRYFIFLFLFVIQFFLIGNTSAQEATEPTEKSNLTGISLPYGCVRVLEPDIPAEVKNALAKLVEAGEGKIIQGKYEVLAWAGEGYNKSKATQLIKQVENILQTTGWTYEIGEQNSEFILFSILRSNPNRRAVLGFFIPTDDALLLAWTEILPANSTAANKPDLVDAYHANKTRTCS